MLDAAIARATAADQLLLVWVGAATGAALAGRAIVLQLDLGAEPRLDVRVAPTLIVLRDGVEIDRVTGPFDPAEMITWWSERPRGESSRQRWQRYPHHDPYELRRRRDRARALAAAGSLDVATEEYAWLWTHAAGRLETRSACSHLVDEMARLAACCAPARARFDELRAATDPGDDPAPEREQLHDWFMLHTICADSAAGLAWFDRMRDRLDMAPARHMEIYLERLVAPLLIDAGRLAEAGALLLDPVGRFERREIQWFESDKDTAHRALVFERIVRPRASLLIRVLRAACRTEEADAVATAARAIDPSSEMAASPA